MKAEDTIMDRDEMFTCSLVSRYPFRDIEDVIKETCIHQDEISVRAGVKKVVDWMAWHKAFLSFDEDDLTEIRMLEKEWQQQLKEWGI